MTTSDAALVRYEQTGGLGVRVTLLDATSRVLDTWVPPVTHSVNGQPPGFVVVHPWLETHGLETTGFWSHVEGNTFESNVRPLIEPFGGTAPVSG